MLFNQEFLFTNSLRQVFTISIWPRLSRDGRYRPTAVIPCKAYAKQFFRGLAFDPHDDPFNYKLLKLWLAAYEKPWAQPRNIHELIEDLVEKWGRGELFIYLDDSPTWRTHHPSSVGEGGGSDGAGGGTDSPRTQGATASGFSGTGGEASTPVTEGASSTTVLALGKKGSWNKSLNGDLKPNHCYKVGGHLYETDELGRVKRVSGKLDLNTRDRNTYQQGKSAKEAGIKEGLSDDDGGHLVASIFDGPGEQINYAPMNSNLNRGAWKCMENEWAAALKAKPPKEVEVDIRPVYKGDSKRPDSFIAKYTIDGKPYKQRFKNKSSKAG